MIWIKEGDARDHKFSEQADIVFCNPNHRVGNNNTELLIKNGDFKWFTQRWMRTATKYLKSDGIFIFTALPECAFDYERMARQEGSIRYRETIIWQYNFGVYQRSRFVKSHMPIFIYQTGDPEFDWRLVSVPSQRLEVGDSRADQRGRNPGDVWTSPTTVWDDIPRMPGNQRQRLTDTPQLPFKLVRRLIRGFKPKRVIDLMTGTGTVPMVCKHLEIDCEAIDINPYMVALAKERIEKFDRSTYMDWGKI